MFTRIQPAGDLFRYIKARRDAMKREREQPAKHLRGSLLAMLRMLRALAPAGVGRSLRPRRGKRRTRPHSEWIRHCQEHLVHLMNCYIEPDAKIQPHLRRILRGTEDLLLAGLPRESLAFVWYEHQKEFGSHPHGGLLRVVLPGGPAYAPQLHPELRMAFDRLVSRRFGFADPLDPAAVSPIRVAWGSDHKDNLAEISAVCDGIEKLWHTPDRELKRRDLFQLLQDLDLPVLLQPNPQTGAPERCRETEFPHLRVQLRHHTVVVASKDRQRPIYFVGTICHFNFADAPLRQKVRRREWLVGQLRDDPGVLYARFQDLLAERIAQQQAQYGRAAVFVDQSHFTQLAEYVKPCEFDTKAALAALDPLIRWSDRAYPFATGDELDGMYADDPEAYPPDGPLPDVTSPWVAPLREDCEALAAEVDRAEYAAQEFQRRERTLAISTAVGVAHQLEREHARACQRQKFSCGLAVQISVSLSGRHLAQQLQEQDRPPQPQRQFAVRIASLVSLWHLAEQESERWRRRRQRQRRLALIISTRVGLAHEQILQRRQVEGKRSLQLAHLIGIGVTHTMENEKEKRMKVELDLAGLRTLKAKEERDLRDLHEALAPRLAELELRKQALGGFLTKTGEGAWWSNFLQLAPAEQAEGIRDRREITEDKGDEVAVWSQYALEALEQVKRDQKSQETENTKTLLDVTTTINDLNLRIEDLQRRLKERQDKRDELVREQKQLDADRTAKEAANESAVEAGDRWAAEFALVSNVEEALAEIAEKHTEIAKLKTSISKRSAAIRKLEEQEEQEEQSQAKPKPSDESPPGEPPTIS